MSDSNVPRKNRLLAILVAFLVVVTAIQGYYLFQVHHQVKANLAYATSNEPPVDKDWHVASPPQTTQDPQGTFPNMSFDPKSWDPFKEMEAMHKQVEQMFDQAFGRFNASPQFNGLSQSVSFDPKSDLEENAQSYIVRMDIPGADVSNITTSLEDRTLTVSGVREKEVTQQGANKSLRHERRLGKFEQVLTLPGPVTVSVQSVYHLFASEIKLSSTPSVENARPSPLPAFAGSVVSKRKKEMHKVTMSIFRMVKNPLHDMMHTNHDIS